MRKAKGSTKWDAVEKTEKRRPRDIDAGHTRREASKRVQDQLDEEAEVMEKETGVMALDVSKLAPDRDILQILTSNRDRKISNALDDYEYCWVRYRSDRGPSGLQVDQKLTWEVQDPEGGGTVPVWEVVSGTMKEAWERRDASGYRVIGDCILMRARKDRYNALMQYLEWQHERRIGTEATTIQEFAEQKRLKTYAFDSNKGLDERGVLAAKSAVSNMKKNFQLDLSAARAIIADAEKNADPKLPLLKRGLKDMLGMAIAQQYVNKRIAEGTLEMKGD